jgi:PAS domain S-box-containing protein
VKEDAFLAFGEASSVPWVVAGADEFIRWSNSAFQLISGFAPGDLNTRTLSSLSADPGESSVFAALWRQALAGAPSGGCRSLLLPSGVRRVQETLIPIPGPAGAVQSVAVLLVPAAAPEPAPPTAPHDTAADLAESWDRLRRKFDTLPEAEFDIAEQDLESILDVPAIQLLMEDITRLTGLVTAILDLKGKILVATGWQRICTQFHRLNPLSARNCTESDLYLARNVRPGDYVAYKCKNQLWDVVTPLFIGQVYAGNIYTGQFFYDDEIVDAEKFRQQALQYGIEPEEYLRALAEVPRVSRQQVRVLMDFLARFATMVSQLSFGNLKLARAMAEQRRISAALQESEENFRLLVEQAPVPIATVDENGAVLYLNRGFVSTFGYSLQDLPDISTWFARAYPDPALRDAARLHWNEAVLQTRSTGLSAHRESQIACRDGSPRQVDIRSAQIGDHFVVLFNDISERKRAEQEHARLEQQLQQSQKMEAVGRLAGGIAHDFNNLLTVINGYGDLLLARASTENPFRSSLRQIREAGERAAELTRQLLAFSRKQVSKPVVLDLNQIVRDSTQMFGRIIGEDIELVCHLDPGLSPVLADSAQISQVLMNLVVNARDAMPLGGDLVIETRNLVSDGTADGPSACLSPGGWVLLTVRDCGTGMSPEVQQHIFEPFFTTKETGKGTGLGLAMVFGIVQQSSGHVWAESRTGAGTTLCVALPRTEWTSPAGAVSASAHPNSSAAGETVLVVEDQPQLLTLTRAILERYGYRVLTALGAAEALSACDSFPETIDALVTDIVMPRINGVELAARIAARRPGIRVLYMSGYTGQTQLEQLPDSPPVDYLQKPFTPAGLARALRECLNRQP